MEIVMPVHSLLHNYANIKVSYIQDIFLFLALIVCACTWRFWGNIVLITPFAGLSLHKTSIRLCLLFMCRLYFCFYFSINKELSSSYICLNACKEGFDSRSCSCNAVRSDFLLANSILNHFNVGEENRLWKLAVSSVQNNLLFSSVLCFMKEGV